MSRTDAAYMRAYRAKKKAEAERDPVAVVGSFTGQVATLRVRIVELEEEVRHLKRELATERSNRVEQVRRKRVGQAVTKELLAHDPVHAFNTRPFTPVPKKGK